MADFIVLSQFAQEWMDEAYERTTKERDEAAHEELYSITKVQTQIRRHFEQSIYKIKRFSVSEIARVFRGYLGRKVCSCCQKSRWDFERKAIFHYYASVIQYAFRGFYSRRYKHDFFARKTYIANILEKSNQLRSQLAANRERAVQEEQERKIQHFQKEFKQVATRLHHLLSTSSRPGVYNSPYSIDGPHTVFGLPVEDHLRNCTTEMLRQNGLRAKKPVYQRNRRSVQADSKYTSPDDAERAESRRSRTMRVSERNFIAGGKGKGPEPTKSIYLGTEYFDKWRATEDGSTRLSDHRGPFHNTVRRNRLFDDIQYEE